MARVKKKKRVAARRFPDRLPRGDLKIWFAKFSNCERRDGLTPGFLITTGGPFPSPIGFVAGDADFTFRATRAIADGKLSTSEMQDLRVCELDELRQIAGRLLYPLDSRGQIDASNPGCAAAQYVRDPVGGFVSAFHIFTARGLAAYQEIQGIIGRSIARASAGGK
ncbi:MAG: hypothetical protein ABSB74_19415 [Tepidisphaeraceae bacterium]